MLRHKIPQVPRYVAHGSSGEACFEKQVERQRGEEHKNRSDRTEDIDGKEKAVAGGRYPDAQSS